MIQVETDRPVYSNIDGNEEFTKRLKPKVVKNKNSIADTKPVVIPPQPKTSWWRKQSKTNKVLIIAGSISLIGIISFMVVRNMNSKKK